MTIKISKTQLRKMIKEALVKEASSLQKDILPGSGDLGKLTKKVDDLILKFAEEARELMTEIEEEIKLDMLGGEGKPSMAPRVGERNRMLMVRVGILKKLSAAAVSAFEALRREG
jgi:hypothetical protein